MPNTWVVLNIPHSVMRFAQWHWVATIITNSHLYVCPPSTSVTVQDEGTKVNEDGYTVQDKLHLWHIV